MEIQAISPFAMMIDPQAVLQAVERSERLQRLQRRVCRPLDEPVEDLDDIRFAGNDARASGLMPLGGYRLD